jgi:NADPH:quinone reductase-like Zn-dependent oxidoreductase
VSVPIGGTESAPPRVAYDRPVKAVRIHEEGGPEVLRYEDVADPVPADGEVLVELRAAALNHIDIWMRKGLPSVPKPRILGSDGAGVLADTGERVVINPALSHDDGIVVLGEHRDGTQAELIAVPRSAVHPIPDALSFEEAAAFPLVFQTAYRMLVTKARVDAGEWVLIWGSGGGVATAALAIAGALGARVAVAASSPAKLERACALGAEAAFDSGDADLPARIRELTGGGAHVVIDDVGEATWARTLAAARRGGRVVVCGATTGSNPPAQLHRIWWRELTVFGSSLGGPADFQGAYELVVSGRARPVVDSVYPLAEAREAHERLERGEQVGKIVLRIPG